MSGLDLVLNRLESHRLRKSGRDRWRACCPAHGGGNPSALSVGVGTDDSVLIKCFHGCETESVLHALGLDWSDILPERALPDGVHAVPKPRRVGLMTSSQAIQLIRDETNIVWATLASLKNGTDITEADLDRAIAAADRVEHVCREYAQ